MARALPTLLIALALILGCAGCGGSTSSRLAPARRGPKASAGLRAAVYATGLPKMSAFAFDPLGRLWVATADYSGRRKAGIFVVKRFGSKPVKVVSGLRTPLGLLWHGGELYVASVGRVDAFGGLHSNRFVRRRMILRGPVRGGENNNLVLAPDGRMVMGVSASCDHCTEGSRFSGAVVSFRPDGSDLRTYATRIRAPFGLAFYPGRDDLFVTMNQRDDLGPRTPGDWLAVVRRGQAWGFPRCYGQSTPACAGVPKPIAVLDKHAAVGGVAIVTRPFGNAAGASAVVAEWQRGSVWQVNLTRKGSTYEGSARPLITGLANPLPLVVARDGSLLVGDWGNGRIYRVS